MRFITIFICFFLTTIAFAEQKIKVEVEWKLKHKCSTISPEIKLSNFPSNTVEISIDLIDQDMRSWDHGGGFVKTENNVTELIIPEGTFKNYNGPCPPNFTSFGHDYEFKVKAKDNQLKLISEGNVVKNFSSKSVTN